MKYIRLLAVVVFVLLSSALMPAAAVPLPEGMTAVPLATITNDRDTSVSQINLMLNERAVVRGIYLETSPAAEGKPPAANDRVYWLGGIESSHGVVLGQGQGVQAILLRGDIEPRNGHGSLVIQYLTNGLFGSYDKCRVALRRTAPYQWQLVSAYTGKPIEHIAVQTWALGISTLTNVCPTA